MIEVQHSCGECAAFNTPFCTYYYGTEPKNQPQTVVVNTWAEFITALYSGYEMTNTPCRLVRNPISKHDHACVDFYPSPSHGESRKEFLRKLESL